MNFLINEKKKIIFICCVIFTLSVLNFFFPVIRFEKQLYNVFYMMIIFTIPFLMTIYGSLIKNGFLRSMAILIGSVVTILSFVFLIVTVISIGLITKDGYNPAFEKIEVYEMESFSVSTYRSNGGATTSFGVVARQEKEVFPGVLLVKDIYKEYPRYEITCEVCDDYLVIDSRKYPLKESVY